MQRSFKLELLDQPEIPVNDLKRNLQELERINKLLGGYTTTLRGIAQIIRQKGRGEEISIVDVGSGGGDTLRKIADWGRKNRLSLNLIGIDLKETCIEYAQERSKNYPEIRFIHSDYALLQLQADIISSALFCHHLSDEALLNFLRWSKANARWGFVINDLHRHFLAYYGIKYLTKCFSKSYLVRNDAPLSVKRSLRFDEWRAILRQADIQNYTLQWQWAFRWLVVASR